MKCNANKKKSLTSKSEMIEGILCEIEKSPRSIVNLCEERFFYLVQNRPIRMILSQECEENTCSNRRTYYACYVRTHSVHKEEV